MQREINDVLTHARLPFHFWTMMTGERTPWDNPGSSLLSFCVLRLNEIYVELSPELEESFQTCLTFSTSTENVLAIAGMLSERVSAFSARLNAKPVVDKDKFAIIKNQGEKATSSLAFIMKGFDVITNAKNVNSLFDIEGEFEKSFLGELIKLKLVIDYLDELLPITIETEPEKA